MANDKKPKKAKPPIVHGAVFQGSKLTGKLVESLQKPGLTPAKKKK